jgi:hypothetical protein
VPPLYGDASVPIPLSHGDNLYIYPPLEMTYISPSPWRHIAYRDERGITIKELVFYFAQ